MQPAKSPDVGNCVFRLRGHFSITNRAHDENLERMVAEDYIRLLGEQGFSADTISAACDEWLLKGKPFFPKISELNEVCKRIDAFRKYQIKKLKRLLEVADEAA